MVGVNGIKPMLGEMDPDSIAVQAGFQADDLITAINNKPVVSWQTASITMISEALDTGIIEVDVTRKTVCKKPTELI